MPGIGKLSEPEIEAASRKSCDVIRNLGPQIQWLHGDVTADEPSCVYIAPDEEPIREHAKQGPLRRIGSRR